MKNNINIKFYGTRGSHPVSGKNFLKYGGNTTTILFKFSDQLSLAIDAGTGMSKLSNDCIKQKVTNFFILFTHFHLDHIRGFPFLKLLYSKKATVNLISPFEKGWEKYVLNQLNGVNFPVKHTDLTANIIISNNLNPSFFKQNGLKISSFLIQHPSPAFAYKFEYEGKTIVCCPDNELGMFTKSRYQEFVNFCKGASLLIHDAQYLDSEIVEKRGWGHSSIGETIQLSKDANVQKCILFHHDPSRTDSDIDKLTKPLSLNESSEIQFAQEHKDIVL